LPAVSYNGTGIGAEGNSAVGIGVDAVGHIGIRTRSDGDSADQKALEVGGVATFSRSGLVTLPAGHANVKVTGFTLFASSIVLATLSRQSGGPGTG
jgi:hypothetical protein